LFDQEGWVDSGVDRGDVSGQARSSVFCELASFDERWGVELIWPVRFEQSLDRLIDLVGIE
jgi:hypothetical protein